MIFDWWEAKWQKQNVRYWLSKEWNVYVDENLNAKQLNGGLYRQYFVTSFWRGLWDASQNLGSFGSGGRRSGWSGIVRLTLSVGICFMNHVRGVGWAGVQVQRAVDVTNICWARKWARDTVAGVRRGRLNVRGPRRRNETKLILAHVFGLFELILRARNSVRRFGAIFMYPLRPTPTSTPANHQAKEPTQPTRQLSSIAGAASASHHPQRANKTPNTQESCMVNVNDICTVSEHYIQIINENVLLGCDDDELRSMKRTMLN